MARTVCQVLIVLMSVQGGVHETVEQPAQQLQKDRLMALGH